MAWAVPTGAEERGRFTRFLTETKENWCHLEKISHTFANFEENRLPFGAPGNRYLVTSFLFFLLVRRMDPPLHTPSRPRYHTLAPVTMPTYDYNIRWDALYSKMAMTQNFKDRLAQRL